MAELVDPTDAEIEALLVAVSDARWVELAEALTRLERAEQPATWAGGDEVVTVVDGVERRAIQMPYVVYGEEVGAARQAVVGVGAIVPFNWMEWHGDEMYAGGAGLDDAPVAEAVRLLTAIVRSDRFCEGSLKGAVDDGSFAAAIRRLLAWHAHRGPTEQT